MKEHTATTHVSPCASAVVTARVLDMMMIKKHSETSAIPITVATHMAIAVTMASSGEESISQSPSPRLSALADGSVVDNVECMGLLHTSNGVYDRDRVSSIQRWWSVLKRSS
mmetsp:Transcript_53869/g.80046  ORF Transcript_53869/g.80046 Transcript_53869/m.80046 type:complete len:112 (+) Transcript_53869:256-591(+)